MMLAGIDRGAFAVAFCSRLRARGVVVDLGGGATFSRALAVTRPRSRGELYWVARVGLVRRAGDLEAFDRVFAAVFDDAVLALDPNARRDAAGRSARPWAPAPDGVAGRSDADEEDAGLPWATRPAPVTARSGGPDDEATLLVPERLPGRLAGLADTPFERLDPAELELLGAWFAAALARWPTRRSRRLRPHPAGAVIALRETLARARRTAFEPVELVRARPVRRRRRVLLLCDVSQSMQPFATAYLQLMRAAVLGVDAEAFAFATRLTRLTPVLAHRSPAAAVEQAGAAVTDRFGGTRIAGCLHALLRSRHGGAARGAIVLIASDGWDSDEPAELAAAMARLRRRAHRVIWLNPRAAAPGYRPLAAGMAAALPYCDDLLPANTVRALGDVLSAVARPR
jgi:uncharacterized protein with von Willebrand factor type A (vWA) domain